MGGQKTSCRQVPGGVSAGTLWLTARHVVHKPPGRSRCCRAAVAWVSRASVSVALMGVGFSGVLTSRRVRADLREVETAGRYLARERHVSERLSLRLASMVNTWFALV